MWSKIINFVKILFNFFYSSRQSISSRTPVSSRSREDVSVPSSAPSAPTELLKKSSFVEVSALRFGASSFFVFHEFVCFYLLFCLFYFIFSWHFLLDYWYHIKIHFQQPAIKFIVYSI